MKAETRASDAVYGQQQQQQPAAAAAASLRIMPRYHRRADGSYPCSGGRVHGVGGASVGPNDVSDV